jgi:hypothetical protein
MTPTLNFTKFICVLLFSSCTYNANKRFGDNINFKDTSYNKQVVAINNGDTILQYDTVYFTPINVTIDTSNFSYEACKQPCAKKDIYKIYFQRDLVVSFCDSMLTVLPLYKNNNDEYIRVERHFYEHLKEQAINNNMGEGIYADDLPILLHRFNPLIINYATNDTPKYIIVTHEGVGSSKEKNDAETYNIKSKLGDTIFLSTSRIKEVEIHQPK